MNETAYIGALLLVAMVILTFFAVIGDMWSWRTRIALAYTASGSMMVTLFAWSLYFVKGL